MFEIGEEVLYRYPFCRKFYSGEIIGLAGKKYVVQYDVTVQDYGILAMKRTIKVAKSMRESRLAKCQKTNEK